jgi:hypothetical protein
VIADNAGNELEKEFKKFEELQEFKEVAGGATVSNGAGFSSMHRNWLGASNKKRFGMHVRASAAGSSSI